MRSNRRPRFRPGAVLLSGLAAIVAAGLVTARILPSEAPTQGPTTVPVPTRPVAMQDSFVVARAFSGRVQARRETVLGFESDGRLARVRVDEGTRVAVGEVVAELDTERLDAKRAELLAALTQARADRALADATLKRMRGVVERGGVSRQRLDEAREGYRAADAAVRLAERRIVSIDVELDKAQLRAPFTGTVVQRLADEGRVLGAGEAVLALQEDAVPEIRVGIAGVVSDRLEPGATHTLTWGDRVVPARLRALLPVRAARARTVDAIFDPVGDTAALLPGDMVTLRLERRVDEPGSWLPLSALAEGERGLWSVYVATAVPDTVEPAETYRVQRRSVEVIHQTSDRVYVRGALVSGDLIVTDGLQRIVPGQRVTLADGGTRPADAAVTLVAGGGHD